jgi:progressive ankylosis protein
LNKLTFRSIFRFWAPLSATWLMMSVEGPFLSAIIARMANPVFNLAAFGVALSFALIVESPVTLLLTASTALVKNRQTFLKLRNFSYSLLALETSFILILIIPQIFYFVSIDLIHLPVEVAKLTHTAVIVLIPWPGAIGYRRFYQGILIRNGLTKKVAYGTIVRVSSMAATGLALHFFTSVNGAVAGAGALIAGVVNEAIVSWLMVRKVIRKIKSGEIDDGTNAVISYTGIFHFYYPLALTAIMNLGVQPMVTFFIGQSRMAIESLAVLPVIVSFTFIFRSVGESYQEVGIALMGKNKAGYKPLKNFALLIGTILTVTIGIIALSPLSNIWFRNVSGLSIELSEFSKLPLIIMTILPALTLLFSFQTAVLVDSRNTKPITFSTIIEFSGILLVIFLSVRFFDLTGVVAAALAFLIGRLGANIYLFVPYFKCLKLVTVKPV